MNFWLKTFGSSTDKLEDNWLTDYSRAERVYFPRNKTPVGWRQGDRFLLYASGWQRIYATATAVGAEYYEHEAGGDRWPWAWDIKVTNCIPKLSDCPLVTEIGVRTLSVRHQSHIHLTQEQYYEGLRLLSKNAI